MDNNLVKQKKEYLETSCEGIKLSEEQEKLYNIMEYSMDNMVITGKAGTGKSELLKTFKNHTTKQVIVLAPTAISALNVGGQTIHSFFRFDFGIQDGDKINNEWYKHTRDELKVVDTIIIDEAAMVRPDLFEAMDKVCSMARKSDCPFGGIQILCFTDFYQLPPVITDKEVARCIKDIYGGIFFFNTLAFKLGGFTIYELDHVFRQKDFDFIDTLNQIRVGINSPEILNKINRNIVASEVDGTITLTATKRASDIINKTKLDEINEKEYIYTSDVKGNIDKGSFPTDFELHLKKGAHVMMVANDKKKRWVNGTLGVITELYPESIKVKIDDMEYLLERYSWEKYKYKYDVSNKKIIQDIDGEFVQFPLKLAWAMTIHKSQSKSFKSVLIDLGESGAFETGMTYVALSRCTSLEKLYLKRAVKPADIKINLEVIEFMKNANIVKLSDLL